MRLRFASLLMLCAAALSTSPLAAQWAGAPKVNVQQGDGQIQVQVLLTPGLCEENYGPWQTYTGTTTKYREYRYSFQGVAHKHYLLWYDTDPAHCYCFNPTTRLFWGKWNNEGQQVTFTKASQKSTTVTQTNFEQTTSTPIAPGTQAAMTPPASFPSDLPPAALQPPPPNGR